MVPRRPGAEALMSTEVNAQAEAAEADKRRAMDAERILRDPIFVEACNALDRDLRAMRERTDIRDTDMHTRLILAEQMHGKVLDYLRAVMSAGAGAQLILRERESFMQRMQRAAVHGIRNTF